MPGPTTESLADDAKELRSDLHKVETSLLAEIHRVEGSLRADIHRVDNALGRLSGEFSALKWIAGLTLVAVLGGVAHAVWSAGRMDARVAAIEARLDRMEPPRPAPGPR